MEDDVKTDTQGECPVTAEAETTMMQLPAKAALIIHLLFTGEKKPFLIGHRLACGWVSTEFSQQQALLGDWRGSGQGRSQEFSFPCFLFLAVPLPWLQPQMQRLFVVLASAGDSGPQTLIPPPPPF